LNASSAALSDGGHDRTVVVVSDSISIVTVIAWKNLTPLILVRKWKFKFKFNNYSLFIPYAI
jgi:hypothetical protein